MSLMVGPERAQINVMLLAATWLDVRGWTIDSDDCQATADSFLRAVDGMSSERLEHALGRVMAHFANRAEYRKAAAEIATRLQRVGLLTNLDVYKRLTGTG